MEPVPVTGGQAPARHTLTPMDKFRVINYYKACFRTAQRKPSNGQEEHADSWNLNQCRLAVRWEWTRFFFLKYNHFYSFTQMFPFNPPRIWVHFLQNKRELNRETTSFQFLKTRAVDVLFQQSSGHISKVQRICRQLFAAVSACTLHVCMACWTQMTPTWKIREANEDVRLHSTFKKHICFNKIKYWTDFFLSLLSKYKINSDTPRESLICFYLLGKEIRALCVLLQLTVNLFRMFSRRWLLPASTSAVKWVNGCVMWDTLPAFWECKPLHKSWEQLLH